MTEADTNQKKSYDVKIPLYSSGQTNRSTVSFEIPLKAGIEYHILQTYNYILTHSDADDYES